MKFLKTLSAVAILAAAALTHSTLNAKAGVTEHRQFFATRTSGEWKITGHAFVIDGEFTAACGIYTSFPTADGQAMFSVNAMVSDLLDKNKNEVDVSYSINWPAVSKNAGSAIRVVTRYKINGVWKDFEDMWNRDGGTGETFSLTIPYSVVTNLFRRASTMYIKIYTHKNTRKHLWLKLNMTGTDVSGEYQRQCANKFLEDMKK
jgi:hypothetical protein